MLTNVYTFFTFLRSVMLQINEYDDDDDDDELVHMYRSTDRVCLPPKYVLSVE